MTILDLVSVIQVNRDDAAARRPSPVAPELLVTGNLVGVVQSACLQMRHCKEAMAANRPEMMSSFAKSSSRAYSRVINPPPRSLAAAFMRS
jgi:hypothetical protein